VVTTGDNIGKLLGFTNQLGPRANRAVAEAWETRKTALSASGQATLARQRSGDTLPSFHAFVVSLRR
jgi:hypothetical protein